MEVMMRVVVDGTLLRWCGDADCGHRLTHYPPGTTCKCDDSSGRVHQTAEDASLVQRSRLWASPLLRNGACWCCTAPLGALGGDADWLYLYWSGRWENFCWKYSTQRSGVIITGILSQVSNYRYVIQVCLGVALVKCWALMWFLRGHAAPRNKSGIQDTIAAWRQN